MGFPELVPGEEALTVGGEIVLRHVHPNFVDADVGALTSQAFSPNSEDAGCMSVARGSVTSPVDAFMEHTTRFGRRSVGVWGVTVAEVEGAGSRCVDDQATEDPIGLTLATGHSYIDFRDIDSNRGQIKKRARELKRLAEERGCMYPPDDRALS